MKKISMILIAALLVCFFIPTTFAQGAKGILVGLNMANVTGDDVEESESLMGLAGGIFLTKPLNDNISFRPELQYSQNGASNDADEDMKLGYIAVPLLLQYAISTQGNMQPVLLFGPYIAFNMSAKFVFDDDEEDIKDDIKSMDYGVIIGGGIAISNKFEITARYIMGLTTFVDVEDVDIKNKTIQFTAGIFL